LKEKGFENATTIKALLESTRLQEQTKDQVILIDEAAMVGTNTIKKLFQISQKQNARVILSGDYKQHQAVEAGDAQRYLEHKGKIPIKRVKEIVRQKDNQDLKKVVQLLANGKHDSAFRLLDKNGRIYEI